jgi:hypothetical protein
VLTVVARGDPLPAQHKVQLKVARDAGDVDGASAVVLQVRSWHSRRVHRHSNMQ